MQNINFKTLNLKLKFWNWRMKTSTQNKPFWFVLDFDQIVRLFVLVASLVSAFRKTLELRQQHFDATQNTNTSIYSKKRSTFFDILNMSKIYGSFWVFENHCSLDKSISSIYFHHLQCPHVSQINQCFKLLWTQHKSSTWKQ